MEWLSCIRQAVEYMEKHMLEDIGPEDVAVYTAMSSMYLNRGFQIISGYTLGEYMRNRRLYLAAVEIANSTTPIIDLAYKYGYDTHGSFDKAFTRFHGCTPKDIRKGTGSIHSFYPLRLEISVQGGYSMEFRIEKKDKLEVVGFMRTFDGETAYEKVPAYWDEMIREHCGHIVKGQAPQTDMEQYIYDHHVGEFGVCLDDTGVPGTFDYMIAGYYDGKEAPEGMYVKVIDEALWAVFDCTLETLQDTNTKIFREWLPGNPDFELTGSYNIEWYSPEGESGPKQKCQIWIPVKEK